ncbi:MAG: hypothetical protein MUF78_02020 [Candidatus Edwardsbacteria bacterium]|jgi:hypothetical protein|nr:hypothetical protein [Candidatus Edwardsbacteria bacterium]
MTCTDIERFLRDHPRQGLPDAATAHLRGCAACRALCRELRGLDQLMAGQPRADAPPYLAARVLAELRSPQRPSAGLRPLWVPFAAAAAGVALVWFSAIRPAQDQGRISRDGEPVAPIAMVDAPAPGAAAPAVAGTKVYPVWPADLDAVADGELSITASLYPALGAADRVRVAVDQRDYTGESEITGEYLIVSPQGLAPGKHLVTVSCAQADGGWRSVSWSFYLMEDAS